VFNIEGSEYKVFCPSGADKAKTAAEQKDMPNNHMIAIVDERPDSFYPQSGPKGYCICPATHYGQSVLWNETTRQPESSMQFKLFCKPCTERRLVQGRFGDNPYPWPFPERNATEDDCRHYRGCKHDPCDFKAMPLVYMFSMIGAYVMAIGIFTYVYKTFVKDWYRAAIAVERKEEAEKKQRIQDVKDLSEQAKEDDYGRRQDAITDKRACC